MRLNEVYKNSGLGKWFHGESANKTPGWDRYDSKGNIAGECGDAKEGDAYSACLSKQKAEKLGKDGRANFVKRKRAAQSKAGRGKKGSGEKGKKPINVDTGASKMEECYECEQDLILEGKNKPNDPEMWSACKSAAKSKFDVYPSAYANAWAAKCYKKKGGTCSSIKEETEMKQVKEEIKVNILNNFMENAKPEFARRGAEKQRPKSWSKGTKSGSDKRKMREEGKRDARDMQEAKSDDFFGTNSGGITRGLDRNYGVEHEPDVESAASATNAHHFQPVDWQDRSKGLQYTKHSRLAQHGIPIEMLDTGTLLPKPQHEAAFAQHPNALAYLRDVKNYHWDSYEWNRGAQLQGFSGARANAAHHTRLGMATKGLIERIRQGQPSPRMGDMSEQTNYYYNKLKENNEIPRHARETPEETPDYYGELEAQRAAGTSNEERHTVADRLTQAHENALAAALQKHGKGSKKPDDFNVIRSYLENIGGHHVEIMNDFNG
jgi:hypothetical protein